MIFVTKRGEVADCPPSPSCPSPLPSFLANSDSRSPSHEQARKTSWMQV